MEARGMKKAGDVCSPGSCALASGREGHHDRRVRLSDAVAAVVACEERVRGEQRCAVCGAPEGTWPSMSAQYAGLLDQIKTVRGETVAEIVEALRAEFQRCSEDSMATDLDMARRDGWLEAAELIELWFGGEKEEA